MTTQVFCILFVNHSRVITIVMASFTFQYTYEKYFVYNMVENNHAANENQSTMCIILLSVDGINWLKYKIGRHCYVLIELSQIHHVWQYLHLSLVTQSLCGRDWSMFLGYYHPCFAVVFVHVEACSVL